MPVWSWGDGRVCSCGDGCWAWDSEFRGSCCDTLDGDGVDHCTCVLCGE
jgi:hypothetical protein